MGETSYKDNSFGIARRSAPLSGQKSASLLGGFPFSFWLPAYGRERHRLASFPFNPQTGRCHNYMFHQCLPAHRLRILFRLLSLLYALRTYIELQADREHGAKGKCVYDILFRLWYLRVIAVNYELLVPKYWKLKQRRFYRFKHRPHRLLRAFVSKWKLIVCRYYPYGICKIIEYQS